MTLTGINHVDEILKKLLRNDTVSADSKTEYDKRMETYFNKQWLLKPASLSPAACSRFGWKCIDKEIISCVTCSATLCVKLPQIWNSLAYEKCEKETVKSLQTAHRKHCPWSLAPSPENFVQMEPEHKGQAYKEFVNRLESLIQIKETLPKIKNGVIEEMGLTSDMISSLCKLSGIPNDEANRSALVLACTGWTKSPSEKKCVTCVNCHRSVSLWFFASLETSLCENDELCSTELNPVKSPSPCKMDEICSEDLNPVKSASLSKQDESYSEEVNPIETASLCKNDEIHPDANPEETASLCKSELLPAEVNSSDSLDKNKQENLSRNDGSDSDLQPAKRIRLITEPLQHFDPLYEHRHWCLWVSPGKSKENVLLSTDKDGEEYNNNCDQDKCSSVPGWRIYLDCLLRNLDGTFGHSPPVQKPTPEKLKKIRQMLESWTPDPIKRMCFEP